MDLAQAVQFLILVQAIEGSISNFHGAAELCLNQPAEYRCEVDSSIILRWRIRDENMTSLDTVSYTDKDDLDPGSFYSIPDVLQFSTDLSSTTPSIISNISFTVQSSINGYTIHCEDAGGDQRNYTINIKDVLSQPTIVNADVSATDIHVNWTSPGTDYCIERYIVSTNSTNISTTDTGVNISLDELFSSPGIPAGDYCISVAAVDTANRTGAFSEPKCIELDVPPEPEIIIPSTDESESIMLLTIVIEFQHSVPFVEKVHVFIDSSPVSGTEVTRIDAAGRFKVQKPFVQTGVGYSVLSFGENILGNGSSASRVLTITKPAISPRSSVPSMTSSRLSTSTVGLTSQFSAIDGSMSPAVSTIPNDKNAHAQLAIAVIFPLTLVMLILVVLIVLLIALLIRKSFKRRKMSIQHEHITVKQMPTTIQDTANLEKTTQEFDDKLCSSSSNQYHSPVIEMTQSKSDKQIPAEYSYVTTVDNDLFHVVEDEKPATTVPSMYSVISHDNFK